MGKILGKIPFRYKISLKTNKKKIKKSETSVDLGSSYELKQCLRESECELDMLRTTYRVNLDN